MYRRQQWIGIGWMAQCIQATPQWPPWSIGQHLDESITGREGLFCKDELWLFNCYYHWNIQYCVISELCGAFICKFSFPSTRRCLKFCLQLFQLVQSIIPFIGIFEICMRATCLHVWWLKSSWFQKHFRFFVKTHLREERQLGAVQLAWSSIISARPF